jgi:hypothetical protein
MHPLGSFFHKRKSPPVGHVAAHQYCLSSYLEFLPWNCHRKSSPCQSAKRPHLPPSAGEEQLDPRSNRLRDGILNTGIELQPGGGRSSPHIPASIFGIPILFLFRTNRAVIGLFFLEAVESTFAHPPLPPPLSASRQSRQHPHPPQLRLHWWHPLLMTVLLLSSSNRVSASASRFSNSSA